MENIVITLSNGKTHLIFTQCEFDEYGIAKPETRKVGSVPIDPSRASKALAHAKTQKWQFVGEPNNGFYDMEVVTAETASESSEVSEGELAQ